MSKQAKRTDVNGTPIVDATAEARQMYDEGRITLDEAKAIGVVFETPPPEVPQVPDNVLPRKGQRSNSAYIFSEFDRKMVWDYGPLGKIVIAIDEIKNALKRDRIFRYGVKQIINDGAALDAGPDGKVSAADKFAEAQARAERLMDEARDDWKVRAGEQAATGPASYVTKGLVALGTFSGASAGKPGMIDVSDAAKANEFVKAVAEFPARGLKGEMGKARTWLEANSKTLRAKIAEIRAAELAAKPAEFDPDAVLDEIKAE